MSGSNADNETSEEKTDPGASRHGNFMNYYQFHLAEERVRQLPCGVWQRRRVAHPDRKYAGLDIGCNTGDLTYILHDFLEKAMSQDQPEISLIGVDLDPILIERARERNPRRDRLTFECLDFLSEDQQSYETLRKYLAQLNKTRFDVVFCFSVTMWIHLNYGDDGLEEFLSRACALAEMIVVEPQPWQCYRKAARRLRKAGLQDFPLLNKLKYTGDTIKHIEDILTRLCGFQKVSISGTNEWGRKIFIYERKS